MTQGAPVTQRASTAPVAALTERERDEGIEFARSYGAQFAAKHRADSGEVIAFAMEGAWRAWLNYDPSRGTLWTTWRFEYVDGYCRHALRKPHGRGWGEFSEQYRLVSLEGSLRGDDDGGLTAADVAPDLRPPVDHSTILGLSLERLLEHLSTDERAAVVGYHVQQQTQAEIATALRISEGRVRSLIQRGLTKLRAVANVVA